jgi:hypothetical protein
VLRRQGGWRRGICSELYKMQSFVSQHERSVFWTGAQSPIERDFVGHCACSLHPPHPPRRATAAVPFVQHVRRLDRGGTAQQRGQGVDGSGVRRVRRRVRRLVPRASARHGRRMQCEPPADSRAAPRSSRSRAGTTASASCAGRASSRSARRQPPSSSSRWSVRSLTRCHRAGSAACRTRASRTRSCS